MIIDKIELNNFRIYKGLNNITLNNNDRRNIFIISGNNGFGKTTFLMSLVWCLYGKHMQDVDDLYKKEIADQGGYSKYIVSSLNKRAFVENDFNFYVSITFKDVNIEELPCKVIEIKRSYNVKTSSSDKIEILIDGEPNELAMEVGPEIFIREFIMPIEIAKFFFFDAEKIVNLAEVNTAEQRKNLSSAYSEVLGIKKYEDLKGQLEFLQLKLRQESASVEEKGFFKSLQVEVENLEERIHENYIKIEELKESRNEKAKDSRDIQTKLIKSGSIITVDELEKLREDENILSKKLEDLQSKLKESYEIIPFVIAGSSLMELSEQIEKEKNYRENQFKNENVKKITNDILTELTGEPTPKDLVIDYKVRKYYLSTFERLINKYFDTKTPSDITDLNILHEFSNSERNELLALIDNLRFSFRESFKKINSDFIKTKNDINFIRKKVRNAEANQEDPIIADFREEKNRLDKEIIKIEDTIESLNREIGTFVNEKTQKGKKIEVLSKKLKVSQKNKKKDSLIVKTVENLKEFLKLFKAQKKESLEKQILEGLNTLMHKKGFVKAVEVEIIGDNIDIILKNIRGEEIKKETLSKGEQQMYATALLRGLVAESDFQFPVFIDSPMQKFDEQHAQNIVKYFYPHISDQVVIFPLINKELTKREYDILSKNIAKTILINNVHEEKSEFVEVDPNNFLTFYNEKYKNAN